MKTFQKRLEIFESFIEEAMSMATAKKLVDKAWKSLQKSGDREARVRHQQAKEILSKVQTGQPLTKSDGSWISMINSAG